MAAIDLVGHAVRDERARARKSLHPSCYLLTGLGALVVAALVLDLLVGLIR
ncbi:MAG TPA: hypothetical protein PLN53_01245 [Terricaulis sp.]|nr:hypothetical protein [Terricaulis sp.]